MKKLMRFAFPILVAAVLVTAPNAEANERQAVQEERVTPFTDMTNEFWAKNEIMWLVDQGIMTGYRDLQFRPFIAITMGEAAQAFNLAISIPGLPDESRQGGSPNEELLIQAMHNAGIFQTPANGLLT